MLNGLVRGVQHARLQLAVFEQVPGGEDGDGRVVGGVVGGRGGEDRGKEEEGEYHRF
jgi:hypothetical protein